MSYEPKVLKSNAGYYVGTTTEEGFPYDRYSGYFSTFEEAEQWLLTTKPTDLVSYFLK